MAQPGLRTATSRNRLGRGGHVSTSRSGDRLHMAAQGNNENAGHGVGMVTAETALLRNKASRTAMASTASASLGKVGAAGVERRRPALGDKTNAQNGTAPAQVNGNDKDTLKHKAPSTVTVHASTARRDGGAHTKPRAVSIHSQASTSKLGATDGPTLTASRSFVGGRHLRGVSSSSGTSLSNNADANAQRNGVARPLPNGLASRRAMSTRADEMDEASAAMVVTHDHEGVHGGHETDTYEPKPFLGLRQPSPAGYSVDEEMSDAESDWRSSSIEEGAISSRTDLEDEVPLGGSALLSSDEELLEDETENEEEEASETESVLLDNLDPECFISLPVHLEELARFKVQRICANYEETVLHDTAIRQAEERRVAVQRGELSAEVAAHEDELAIMGLDPEEVRDTSMVAEYAAEIFEYMAKCECRTMANPNYMDFQGEIRWHMRATLVDWLMQVHMRYHMMPETLWIAMNVVDRFLSARVVSLAKLQLVGVTAMFIAAKYEEILAPSVEEFVFMTENGYTRDEILKGERIILSTLDFNISSYCSPYSWVRRISKADDYDIQTRTLAKFFMELTLFDHRFLRAKPSLIAAIAMYLSRRMLGGSWSDAFVYYSHHVEEQLAPGANLLLERLLDESFLDCFVCQKYGNRKYLKASIFARDWALRNQDTILATSQSQASNMSALSGQTTAVAPNGVHGEEMASTSSSATVSLATGSQPTMVDGVHAATTIPSASAPAATVY